MVKRIPWQDLDKILAKIVPRSSQDLTNISIEGQPTPSKLAVLHNMIFNEQKYDIQFDHNLGLL